MGLVLVTPPASEPIAVDAVLKTMVRVEHSLEDDFLLRKIREARSNAEHHSERQLITATWRLTLDGFPLGGGIVLPRPRLLSVISITYVDTTGVTQTLATTEYAVDTDNEPGWVVPSYDAGEWPDTLEQTNAVRITYTAGYGPGQDDVPDELKDLMRAEVAMKYDQRVPPWPGLETILQGYRKYWHGCMTVNV